MSNLRPERISRTSTAITSSLDDHFALFVLHVFDGDRLFRDRRPIKTVSVLPLSLLSLLSSS